MRKIDLNGLDVSVYKEKLSNNLDIYLVPYSNKKNYYISYATYYGSDILEFSTDKGNYSPPLGIAHFLEHKMFDEENGEDPFHFFSNTGTDSNASTSYDNTQYICYGNKNFKENLRYLIQFVNHPYFTEESVTKEKGIIAEEIAMYQDMPDFVLEMTLRNCLFKNSSRKYDIAGSVSSIEKITKDDLYLCYNHFYVPNHMFLLIVGNFSIDTALEIIHEELDSKREVELPKIIKKNEPNKVSKKEMNIVGNIEKSKLAFGLKIHSKEIEVKNNELDYYLNMLTTILFGASSLFRERVREANLISEFHTYWESFDSFKIFYLMASTRDNSLLLEEILKEIKDCSIDEESFERIKKVWIANEVKMMDTIEGCVDILYDDILKYRKVIPNKINCIRNLKFSVLKQIINQIDFTNYSVVKMEKNVKND